MAFYPTKLTGKCIIVLKIYVIVNIFELKIWMMRGGCKITFILCRQKMPRRNETDKFFEKYDADTKYKSAAAELL